LALLRVAVGVDHRKRATDHDVAVLPIGVLIDHLENVHHIPRAPMRTRLDVEVVVERDLDVDRLARLGGGLDRDPVNVAVAVAELVLDGVLQLPGRVRFRLRLGLGGLGLGGFGLRFWRRGRLLRGRAPRSPALRRAPTSSSCLRPDANHR